jgi:hypothetical protein
MVGGLTQMSRNLEPRMQHHFSLAHTDRERERA